ncbi:hypothetical protein NPIL_197271 [Nephila pilipes]|uniref:Uncharacterized protein n=1 Tax=Nephila pilipes TaxID=299642 RepID=A0A8X6PNY9_NEPPI|nr:hypothetical protein NPIL_197271 [Nephila pilipes]
MEQLYQNEVGGPVLKNYCIVTTCCISLRLLKIKVIHEKKIAPNLAVSLFPVIEKLYKYLERSRFMAVVLKKTLGEESSNYDVCKRNDSTPPKHGSRLLQGLFATVRRIPRHGTLSKERGIIFI